MDRLKKERTPLRKAVTLAIKEIELEVAKVPPNVDELDDHSTQLLDLYERLSAVDVKILKQMADDNVADDVYEAEWNAMQDYNKKMIKAKNKINRILARAQVPQPPPTPPPAASVVDVDDSTCDKKKSFRLPKLELKKFNGQLTEWISFWSQFKKIDEDEELHATDKFQYLLQAMEPNSRPMEVVSSYPPSEDNYPKAMKALKERFGNDDLLVEVYVRELLKLVISNVNSPNGKPRVSSFFDRVESHLRALETFGVTSDRYASMLFPLVESSLPEDTLRAWQRSPLVTEELKDGKTRLSCLIDFLRREVEAEERIKLAKSGFGLPQERKKKATMESEVPTAAGLHSGVSTKCIFCDRAHESKDCSKAQDLSLTERKSRVEAKRCCFTCLRPGHTSQKCRSYIKCPVCGRKHSILLCNDLDKKKNSPSSEEVKTQVTGSMSASACTGEVILQTLFVKVCGARKNRVVRALVDTGSQRSYLLQSTAEEMEIFSATNEVIIHALFGGHHTEKTNHSRLAVQLRKPDGSSPIKLVLLSQKKICGRIPRMSRQEVPWDTLKKFGVHLSDVGTGTPPIEVLLGADACGSILTGKGHQLGGGLVALETVLGWTVMGALNNTTVSTELSIASEVVSMTINDYGCESMWALETLGVTDPAEALTRQEQDDLAKERFLATLKRKADGRYSVPLPWVSQDRLIPSNYDVAVKRLESAVRKLDKHNHYALYESIFEAWRQEGIVEEVNLECNNNCHYLPHRPVFKPESLTTPVRPVFDASCRTAGNLSLNDILEKGPNLLELIPAVLLRFRMGKIGFTSDIRKAFQMIEIEEEDRDMLRFLWYDSSRKNIKVFRHARVVFGVSSSSFLLGATIEHHLRSVEKKHDGVAKKLLSSIYVDNCVSSFDTREQYLQFKGAAINIMKEAQMELRQWEETAEEVPGVGSPTNWECGLGASSSHPQDVESPSVANVLGIKWNKTRDTLFCLVEAGEKFAETTKRSVLSALSRIFDPLGITSPAVLPAKKIVQKLWNMKIGWDEHLPTEERVEFDRWNSELEQLKNIEIPRWIFTESSQGSKSIHIFCDASIIAYSAVVFMRSKGANVNVQLLMAKSRLAPVKKSTIPRLELMGCLLGVRLAKTVVAAIEFDGPMFYWTDSTTALQWIRRTEQWGVFVNNRVKEIRLSSSSSQWRHVPGTMNPADLPSRGCLPSQLVTSRWWEGPLWLKDEEGQWPATAETVDENAVTQEAKKVCVSAVMLSLENVPWYDFKFSPYSSCVRVMGWIRRFIAACQKRKCASVVLTAEEIVQAELILFKCVQRDHFGGDLRKQVIHGIYVECDRDGLLRVKTKLLHKEDSIGFKLPVLLPSTSVIVERLIRWEHQQNGHAGVQFILNKLRERVWLIGGRKAVKKVIGKCVVCRRFAARSSAVEPAGLPVPRVTPTKAFQTTGVDCAGPLYLKDGSKSYIVIFTCAVFRCVHLELVMSMSTEGFILALWKFVNRRGRPSIVYSDNGRNFTGANNAFAQLNWNRIYKETACHRIEWRFNPPTGAWWGGFWERLIRDMKDRLKRMLGHRKLTFFQLDSCVVEVEGIMNDRPLTYVSEDSDDLIPLTPSLFLRGLPVAEIPETAALTGEDLRGSVRSLNQLRDELKTRFRKEYLATLVHKGKLGHPRQWRVGEVVLIGADNQKRLMWNMGRVIELLPGKDGCVRVVKVRTSNGILIRPVQRLFPMEVLDAQELLEVKSVDSKREEPEVENSEIVTKTKSGRIVKVPDRLRYN